MDLDLQKQLELEAEAELELEQEQQAAQQQPQVFRSPEERAARVTTGGLLNILNGATLNFGDEIVGGANAGIDYLVNKFTGENPEAGISDFYNERTRQTKELRGEFNAESPVGAVVTELGGSFLNPLSFASKAKNVGRAEKILRAVATGAAQGGIYGLGEDQNRLENAGEGALWGGALGVTLESLLGSNTLKDIGGRLQRGAMGIRQSDVKSAANTVAKGADNPLISAFDNLYEEGVFKGSKAPGDVQARIADRAAGLSTKLDDVIAAGSSAAPPGLPNFPSTEAMLAKLKGTDHIDARKIFNDEVDALIGTLDNGGTIDDWQAAKRSIQGNTKYGNSSESLRNEVRQKIASDIRQHIEDQVDTFVPGSSGQVKGLNKKLSDGLRVNEVLERGKNADLAADPEAKLKQLLRTSGGYGVPMILAGGAEYGRTGDLGAAAKVGLAASVLGSRSGKFNLGSTLRNVNKLTPAILKMAAPVFVKQIAKQNENEAEAARPKAPLEYFKAGANGIKQYKEQVGATEEQLDSLYREVTSSYRNFAAPNGKVNADKARKWIANNQEALNVLPELRDQLNKPESAQRLIDRHFQGEQPLSQADAERAALREFIPVGDDKLVSEIFKSKNPTENSRQVAAFIGKDKEALAGLRRATVDYIKTPLENGANPYEKVRDTLEKGKIFTASQVKVADYLYGKESEEHTGSTLKALADMARGGFLSSGAHGKYIEQIEPLLKSMPPEVVRERLEQALYDPTLARDLMNKATSKNISSAMQRVFGGDIQKATQPSYDTKLEPQEEAKFKNWVSELSARDGRDRMRDLEDYDLRGLFKELNGAMPPEGHFTDAYKKPNHPTFSNESKYSSAANPGGSWQGEKFTPPAKPQPIPKQEQVLAKSSFPDPEDLLKPPTPGSLKKISFNVKEFIAQQPAETRARVSVESAGNPWATSRKGAQGLAQLMPATAMEIAESLGEEYMPLRPGMSPEEQRASIEQNIRFGDYYYKKQLAKYKDATLARAAYNAGPARVDAAIRLSGSSRDVNKVLSNLPKGVQKETIPYVQEIARRYGNV